MSRMLLVGREPDRPLGHSYVKEPPFDGVLLGSLTLGELLHFSNEGVLTALAQGLPVELYVPGLPEAPANRALAAALAARRRELQSWGVRFVSGSAPRLITATAARELLAQGRRPDRDAVLTPLAREILEEKT